MSQGEATWLGPLRKCPSYDIFQVELQGGSDSRFRASQAQLDLAIPVSWLYTDSQIDFLYGPWSVRFLPSSIHQVLTWLQLQSRASVFRDAYDHDLFPPWELRFRTLGFREQNAVKVEEKYPLEKYPNNFKGSLKSSIKHLQFLERFLQFYNLEFPC